jgi:orotate phosphoribosyltransferase
MIQNPNFNKNNFNQFVNDNNVVGFFKEPVKLKSGRMSNWYVNWRTVTEDVYLTDKLSNFVLDFKEDLGLNVDCFYGVPEGATKLAIITQYKLAKEISYWPGSHPLAMGRGKPKEHGAEKDRFFLGIPKGRTII